MLIEKVQRASSLTIFLRMDSEAKMSIGYYTNETTTDTYNYETRDPVVYKMEMR